MTEKDNAATPAVSAQVMSKNGVHSACKNRNDMDMENEVLKNNMEEMRSAAVCWERARRLTQDRVIWRDLAEALCATGYYEID